MTLTKCRVCGIDSYIPDYRLKGRHYECNDCKRNINRNTARSTKARCVEYKGGKCIICGVVGPPEIYDFHHEDPSLKEFTIGGKSRSFESVKLELDKCLLLCSNCHRTVHAKSKANTILC